MKRGRIRALVGGITASAALLAVAPTGASAATQLGETFTPDATPCAGDTTYLQTGSPGDQYIVPQAGVITSWSYQAPASPPQVKFKVGRAAGTDTFTIIGESDLKTPSAGSFNTYPIQLPVRADDVIGIYLASESNCGVLDGDYSDHYFNDDVRRGETEVFIPEGNLQFNIAASFDPETKKCKGQAPTIAGTPDKDTLVGTADDDVIVGLGGKDKLKGLEGADRLCGQGGKDKLKGGSGKDKLKGGKKADKLNGGGGEDNCSGGGGDDTAKKCEIEKSL